MNHKKLKTIVSKNKFNLKNISVKVWNNLSKKIRQYRLTNIISQMKINYPYIKIKQEI